MITDRNKLNFVTICGCLCLWAAAASTVDGLTIQQQQQQQSQSQQQQQQLTTIDESKHQPDVAAFEAERRVLNPKMDYNNEWRPVGRGDPLKNDPTYDYSPPALERVRYWADSGDSKDGEKEKDSNNGDGNNKSTNNNKDPKKNEVLLLGMSHERVRPTAERKNAKGEAPLVQPKYTSIRRSYYAHHQLPTRLMPPPMMHSMNGAPNSMMNSMNGGASNTMMMLKPATGDYRHNIVPSYSATSSAPTSFSPSSSSSSPSSYSSSSSMHSKPSYYSTAASSPWTHHPHTSSSPTPMSSYMTSHSMPHGSMAQQQQQHHYQVMSSHLGHDSHHQESVNYLSYTRPSTTYTMESSYSSPNGIRLSQNSLKQGSGGHHKKPWLHELLQKEVIKPARPTMPATKYLMGTTKPHYESHVGGISTTYAPVSFVSSMATSTTPRNPSPMMMMSYTPSPVYVTTTAVPMPTPPAILTSTTPRTIPTVASTTTTTTRRPTTTTTSTPSPYNGNRLLIPTTSNLAFRPTVAPLEMTTDSLFSHYNQPEKPLMGPMYLIIEGHSKVKTYGKNELDPHQPKIVPIIPKREPIVRVADPNQRNRGTVETFQVKHLHTKTTPISATSTEATKTTTTTTTTKRPAATTAKSATMKPATMKPTTSKPTALKTTTSKPTTVKPTTSKPTTPKPTSSKPVTTPKSMITSKPSTTTKSTTMTPKATTAMKTTTASFRPTAIPPTKASSTVLTKVEPQPPTGMQGLLSLLDASLGSIFKEGPSAYGTQGEPATKLESKIFVTTKPPKQQQEQQLGEKLEARIGSKGDTIAAAAEEDYDEEFGVTTEPLPREVRQVYDYDNLPESRLKQMLDESYEDEEGEAWMKSVYDDEYEDEETGQRIKRIDKVMDYEEEGEEEVDDDEGEEEDDEEEANEEEEEEKVQSPPLRKA